MPSANGQRDVNGPTIGEQDLRSEPGIEADAGEHPWVVCSAREGQVAISDSLSAD
jgi:hypothetical protein